MWCHILLAMPAVGLLLFLFLPLMVALPMYGVVATASLLLYYKVLQAMRLRVTTGMEAMLGAEAEVVSRLDDGGLSQYIVWQQGEQWSAISPEELHEGDKVRVVGFEGMRPVVRSLRSEATETVYGSRRPA